MPSEGTVYERNGLPENVVISCEIEIIGYFEPEDPAEMKYGTRLNIDTTKSSVIGLVEMVKHDLMNKYFDEDDD